MRFLRVIASMDPASGGPCQGIRNSIPALKNLGVSTEVISLDDPTAQFLGNDEFTIIPLGPGKSPYRYSAKWSSWLRNHLAAYDVVIIHGLWLYNSYGTYKAWKKLKSSGKKIPRLYVMPHGMLDPYFQKAPERKWKAFRNRVFWKLFEHRVVNNVDGVLFTCEQELRLAQETFVPYNPQAVLNIGYGIQSPPKPTTEQEQAFHSICPKLRGKSYWLFLSRIHPKKGVDLLIKAYIQLQKHRANLPALVIAGPGMDTAYGEELKNLSKNSPDVYFPGMLQGAQKWGAFYHAEAFVLPSHQENFGIAVAEALACAVPVLISDQVNIWREIEAGKAGVVFKDTCNATYTSLKEFDKYTSEQKEQMKANAVDVYNRCFTIEAAAKQMLKQVKGLSEASKETNNG